MSSIKAVRAVLANAHLNRMDDERLLKLTYGAWGQAP